jgi:hypothetical protein
MVRSRCAWIVAAAALTLAACGKDEKQATPPDAQLQRQAEQARLLLQNKADEMARNPPPEVIEAARREVQQQSKGQ